MTETQAAKPDLTPPSKAAGKQPINGEGKAAKAPKTPKEPKAPRLSSLSKTYPATSNVTVLAKENPKKKGSKAFDRFAHYAKAKTVGEFVKAGGTMADVAYDVGHGHIKVDAAA